MFAQKLLWDFDSRKQVLRRQLFQAPRFLMLARLPEIDAVGRAIKRELSLLTAALRTNAPVDPRTEALFLAHAANRTTQTAHLCGWRTPLKVTIMAPSAWWNPPKPHKQRLSEPDLWKNRIKSGENAFHRDEVVVR